MNISEHMRVASEALRASLTPSNIQDGVDMLLASQLLSEGSAEAARRIMTRLSPEAKAHVALVGATVTV